MVTRPEAQEQGWERHNPSGGDAAPLLGLLWGGGKGRALLQLTVVQAFLSDRVLPVTWCRSAWLLVEGYDNTRRPRPCKLMAVLTVWCWSWGDAVRRDCGAARVRLCAGLVTSLLLSPTRLKVPYGCGTSPLRRLLEKSLTNALHSLPVCWGEELWAVLYTREGASPSQVEMCPPQVQGLWLCCLFFL